VYFLFQYLRFKNLKINFSNCCPRRNLGIFVNHYIIGYEESFSRKIARFQRGQHRGKNFWNFQINFYTCSRAQKIFLIFFIDRGCYLLYNYERIILLSLSNKKIWFLKVLQYLIFRPSPLRDRALT